MYKKTIVGKLQAGENFGFLIPEDRDYYGGDFYVKKGNFGGAVNGDTVEAMEVKSTGKKLEAKIVKVQGKDKPSNNQTFAEGIYSGGDGNYGFIDVEGQTKGYFVHGKNKNGARDGDKVKAEIIEFNGKLEGIIVKVFETESELKVGIFKDSDRFGFVVSEDNKNDDIFIAGSRKNGAKDGDKVEVKIIKRGGKNPEGVIERII